MRSNLVEYFEQKQGGEKTILVSVAIHILEDLDAEEFRLLAKSAGAEILEHVHAQRFKPDANISLVQAKQKKLLLVLRSLKPHW